jgi:glucose-1-phosphate cytidylyltransferase
MQDGPQVVILCGGEGTRLREETEFKPKPLVLIGGRPILWHIMKYYSHFGFKRFVLALGYKGEMIKDYFLNYQALANDFALNLRDGQRRMLQPNATEDWEIVFADTGLKTQTGGRIKRVEKYIDGERFMATYGDGVGNVDIRSLLSFHLSHGKHATLTAVKPWSKYGKLQLEADNRVAHFIEKPMLDDLINGGFFVFNRPVFDYLTDDCVLEKEPFEAMVRGGQMVAYRHPGFWHCMDTFKDVLTLNSIWETSRAPWRVWD